MVVERQQNSLYFPTCVPATEGMIIKITVFGKDNWYIWSEVFYLRLIQLAAESLSHLLPHKPLFSEICAIVGCLRPKSKAANRVQIGQGDIIYKGPINGWYLFRKSWMWNLMGTKDKTRHTEIGINIKYWKYKLKDNWSIKYWTHARFCCKRCHAKSNPEKWLWKRKKQRLCCKSKTKSTCRYETHIILSSIQKETIY